VASLATGTAKNWLPAISGTLVCVDSFLDCSALKRAVTSGIVVTRMVDSSGYVSFAATMYRVGRSWRGKEVEVSIVAGSVQIVCDGTVVRTHAIRHDRAKEHGAFATPHGRPRKPRQDAPGESANHARAGNDPDITTSVSV
jgi:hypothetical protein